MPVNVGAREFIGSSVYDLLTKLSIYGNKGTKVLKLLSEIAETVPDRSGAEEMRDRSIRIRNALSIGSAVV